MHLANMSSINNALMTAGAEARISTIYDISKQKKDVRLHTHRGQNENTAKPDTWQERVVLRVIANNRQAVMPHGKEGKELLSQANRH